MHVHLCIYTHAHTLLFQACPIFPLHLKLSPLQEALRVLLSILAVSWILLFRTEISEVVSGV